MPVLCLLLPAAVLVAMAGGCKGGEAAGNSAADKDMRAVMQGKKDVGPMPDDVRQKMEAAMKKNMGGNRPAAAAAAANTNPAANSSPAPK
jgi:hypothetical protein